MVKSRDSVQSEFPDGASDRKAFAGRLAIATAGSSRRAFASRAGVSPTVLGQYLAGESEPTRPALIAMANAANVSPLWLMTGEGPQDRQELTRLLGQLTENTNENLLEEVIAGVEMFLADRRLNIPSDKKARLITTIYSLATSAEKKLASSSSLIEQLVRLVS